VFVHRVGRTARAGRTGWAWNLIGAQELPFLLDLELFLNRPVVATLPSASSSSDGVDGRGEKSDEPYTSHLVLGPLPRERLDSEVEYIRALDAEDTSLPTLRAVMNKGHAMYERSRGKASQASYRRAKEMSREASKWGLAGSAEVGVHPVLLHRATPSSSVGKSGEGAEEDALREARETEEKRRVLMEKVHAFRPAETVLEVGSKASKTETAALMRDRRKALVKAQRRAEVMRAAPQEEEHDEGDDASGVEEAQGAEHVEVAMADEEDIEVCRFAVNTIMDR
jgi:ATP-dependent RNA helicase DDX54/DBP10